MVWLLAALMLCLLVRAQVTMDAASAACRLFVTSVLPGLMPYMVLSQMLVSRVKRLSPGLILLLGWGGGSPTGARLVHLRPDIPRKAALRLSISCATMSPMFLLGTVGGWLGSGMAGMVVLGSVIAGGWLAGIIAAWYCRKSPLSHPQADASSPKGRASDCLAFGAAVESSARTMLLVCGTMVMLRVFAALAMEVLPAAARLPVTTLLEVTTGTSAIAGMPLPLPIRTALIAGATGFGGMAVIMQNRAVMGVSIMPLWQQVLWQTAHGIISFVTALGMMTLLC